MQQAAKGGVSDYAWLDRKSDPLGIVQKIECWPLHHMVYSATKISPKNETHKIELKMDHLIPARELYHSQIRICVKRT